MENPSTRGWPSEGSAPIACLGCRRLKMRCVMPPENQPCVRCAKAGRQCIIQPSRRGFQKDSPAQKPKSQRKRRSSMSGLEASSSCLPQPPTHLVLQRSPTESATRTSSPSRTPSYSRPKVQNPQLDTEVNIAEETLQDLVRFFREKLLYFVPVLADTDLDNMTLVVQQQRPLALCAGIVSSKFVPGGASLQTVLQPLVSDFLATLEGPISTDEDTIWMQLQSCAILYAYRASNDVTNPVKQAEEERRLNHWRMKATIENFAMRLCLHRALDDVKAYVKQGHSAVSHTFAFRKAIYWLWLFTMSHHFSLVTETPPTIRQDNSIRNACIVLSQVDIPPRVGRILAEIDLCMLWNLVELQLPGLGEWWCSPPDDLDPEQASRVLDDADRALGVWSRRWGTQGQPDATYPGLDVANNGTVDYHFRATRFWVHMFAARIIQQQSDFASNKTSRAGQLYTDLVLKSVEAAEQCSRYLIELRPLKRDSARFMADFGFALIAFCCVYITRIERLVGGSYPLLTTYITSVEQCGKLLSEMAVGSNQTPLIYGNFVRDSLHHSELASTQSIVDMDIISVVQQCRADLQLIDRRT